MPAMLDLITLYREALHEPDSELSVPHDAPELGMDYFDTIIAQNYSNVEENSIREFLGLSTDEEFDGNRVVIQSIPLYCPACVYDTFHKKYPDRYQNPFLVKEYYGWNHRVLLPYLSVIEVFISPEIIARLDINAVCENRHGDCFDMEESKALKIYNAFYRDLHMLMEGFLGDAKKNLGPDEEFIYCIYESVSAGDFALVIRSRRPDTAHKVTALLRERSCRLKYADPKLEREYDPKELKIYRTFSLFCMTDILDEQLSVSKTDRKKATDYNVKDRRETEELVIIPAEDEQHKGFSDGSDTCRYVLRGVLSNRYWNIYMKDFEPDLQSSVRSTGYRIRDILNDAELRRHVQRLHGRYDFMISLSEQAFKAIYPVLVHYKLNRNNELPIAGGMLEIRKLLWAYPLDETEKLICETLLIYICKGYVSYIIERYLFNPDTSYINVKKYNEDICLKPVEEHLMSLNSYIEGEIHSLKDRIKITGRGLQALNTSRSSLMYSMKFLERLASTCSSINSVSDVRIISLVICRQIGAVLNGIDEYISYLEDYNDLSVISHLDQDIKTAAESINSFAQIFMKSTVQFLQMPVYNMESHASAEKMLTGYSWLLQSILRWFEESFFSRQIRGLTQKYLAVMVPERFDGELSTQSLFFMLNERRSASKEKLLTATCPSFSHLTDFSSAFGILFHEMSHYIRFEKSYDRNRMILEYSSWLLFDQTADQIMRDFCNNTSELNDIVDIQIKHNLRKS